jgi:hypothetical protein
MFWANLLRYGNSECPNRSSVPRRFLVVKYLWEVLYEWRYEQGATHYTYGSLEKASAKRGEWRVVAQHSAQGWSVLRCYASWPPSG